MDSEVGKEMWIRERRKCRVYWLFGKKIMLLIVCNYEWEKKGKSLNIPMNSFPNSVFVIVGIREWFYDFLHISQVQSNIPALPIHWSWCLSEHLMQITINLNLCSHVFFHE